MTLLSPKIIKEIVEDIASKTNRPVLSVSSDTQKIPVFIDKTPSTDFFTDTGTQKLKKIKVTPSHEVSGEKNSLFSAIYEKSCAFLGIKTKKVIHQEKMKVLNMYLGNGDPQEALGEFNLLCFIDNIREAKKLAQTSKILGPLKWRGEDEIIKKAEIDEFQYSTFKLLTPSEKAAYKSGAKVIHHTSYSFNVLDYLAFRLSKMPENSKEYKDLFKAYKYLEKIADSEINSDMILK